MAWTAIASARSLVLHCSHTKSSREPTRLDQVPRGAVTLTAERKSMPRQKSGPSERLAEPVVAGAVVIVLATLLAYLPALSGGYIWDDDAYVTNNPLLTAPDGFSRIWLSAHQQSQYFPLVFTTLRLEHALWG